ncbi:MAG: lyase family protein [Bacteroidales bacterium]
MFRIEKDQIGEMQVPSDALYGIHALRARHNFPDTTPFPVEWYKAAGLTKLACYITYRNFRNAATEKYKDHPAVKIIPDEVLNPMMEAAKGIAEGKYFDNFIVPAVQGGAGTSINMNINEIISNVALIKTGNKCGTYTYIDPTEHANIYQSTNDIIPTALTVAAMFLFQSLEGQINTLRSGLEELERRTVNMLRPGYTQMQEAVPSSFGRLFSTYNEALSRDWWRVSKCIERLKPVNLGGGATGTGMSVPRFFIMHVVEELRSLTRLPIARSENLSDATSNLDKWVEVHATMKSLAVNLEKMASDLRLLASDVAKGKTIAIPEKQVGSSIMPGKINPVIAEYIISVSHKVYSNDNLVSSLCGQGCLELNAYLPVTGCTVIESIKLLISSCKTAKENLIDGLAVNESAAYESLLRSPSLSTALIPYTGYHKASGVAGLMKEKNCNIFEANDILKIISEAQLREILQPGNLLKLGFSLDELTGSTRDNPEG